MTVLLDANFLLRPATPVSPSHAAAMKAVPGASFRLLFPHPAPSEELINNCAEQQRQTN